MPKDENSKTGTLDILNGFEKLPTMARSVRVPEVEELEALIAVVPSTTSEEREALKDAIYGPVLAMTDISRHPEAAQKEIWRFWLDSLDGFPIVLVRKAFVLFTRSEKRFVSPSDIVQIIQEERGKAGKELARLKQIERKRREEEEYKWRSENRASPEQVKRIIREAGFNLRLSMNSSEYEEDD